MGLIPEQLFRIHKEQKEENKDSVGIILKM